MVISSSASTSRGNSAHPTSTYHPFSGPSHYSATQHSQEEPFTAKRRKVAPAQPPRVYAGFSSTDVTQGAEYRPHRTRSTSSFRGTAATGLAGKGSYTKDPPSVSGVKVSQHPRSTYTSNNPTKVRKVHRLVSEDGKDTGDIITPSSWRAGKELAERILKAQQRAEELLSDSSLDHSSSAASRLSFRDSLDPSSHASSPSHAYHSLSDARLHSGEPEKPAAHSPDHRGAAEDSDEGSEVVSAYETVVEGPPRASSDVDRLLEDLRASSREAEAGATGVGSRGKAAATGRGSAGKTKYNYGKL